MKILNWASIPLSPFRAPFVGEKRLLGNWPGFESDWQKFGLYIDTLPVAADPFNLRLENNHKLAHSEY